MSNATTDQMIQETAGTPVPWFRQWSWQISLGVVLLGFFPILSIFFRQQWQRAEYQAFPLLILCAGLFLWMRLQEATPVNRSRWWISGFAWICVAVSLFVLGVSFWVFSPWLAMIAFVIYAFAVACFIWQNWIVDGLWGIWILLVLLVPPPLDRDQMFIESLQLFSSRVTSMLLDVFGVLHVMQGNVLSFSDRQLFVDEACSGIMSLISIVYCIALFCVWQRRRFLHSVILIAAGVGWTILMNSIRLLTIGLAWAWYKSDLAEGLPHQILSAVMFAISVGVVIVLDRLLNGILAPIDVRWRAGDRESHPGLKLMKIWDDLFANRDTTEENELLPEEDGRGNRGAFSASVERLTSPRSVFGWPAAACFGLMGILYLGFFGVQESIVRTAVNQSIVRALALNEETDPGDGAGLKLISFSNERRELFRWDLWGQYSRTWTYEDDDGTDYMLSCDFLFGPHWHDLRVCYRGTGWKIDSEKIVPFAELGNLKREPLEVENSLTAPWLLEQFSTGRKNELARSLVTYGAFRATGNWFNRPRGTGLIGNFLAHFAQGRDRAEQADYYQVQVTTNYQGELSTEQQQRAENLLKVAVENFRKELVVERSGINAGE